MKKECALYKLEEAKELIVEAQYIINEIVSQCNILGVTNNDFLKVVTDIIKLLSVLDFNGGANLDIPIEGVYKLLYYDYKKVCKEKKELQQDVLVLMQEKEWDTETASLNLKLIRSERNVEQLTKRIETYKRKIKDYKKISRDLKDILKRNNILIDLSSLSDDEDDIPDD